MNSLEQQLHKYAELVLKVGVNLQPGQVLYLGAPLECAEFARIIVRKAWCQRQRGARRFHGRIGSARYRRRAGRWYTGAVVSPRKLDILYLKQKAIQTSFLRQMAFSYYLSMICAVTIAWPTS